MRGKLSGENEVEKEFEASNKAIDEMAEEELRKIRKKAKKIRAEAVEVGEAVEKSIKQGEPECSKKS